MSPVEAAARTAFPGADLGPILKLLGTYGVEPYERERERVQLAIIKLCAGDAATLVYHVRVAKVDYRDTLAAADRPPPTPDEAVCDMAAAREVLGLWGKK